MAINDVTSKALGITLQIYFEEGFTSLVNNDVEDFKSIEAISATDGAAAREIRFAVEPARQPSNVQMVDPGNANAPLINGFYDAIVERTAKAKQLEVVAEFDLDVYNRAKMDPSLVYIGPMQLALYNKMVSAKESLVKQFYGDGTGVQGTILGTPTVNAGVMTITLLNTSAALGCIYWIQEQQHLVAASTAGTVHQPTVTSGTPAYLKVTAVDYANKTISVMAYDASDVALNITAVNTVATTNILFNYSDIANITTLPDTTSVADYGALLYMPGLQSLGADDGRTVHGVALSGNYAGTVVDKGGAVLQFPVFSELANKLDRRVGRGKYIYNNLRCSYDAWDFMVNMDAGNQYLKPVENIHGGKEYMFQRKNMAMVLDSHRFVPDFNIWAEPSLKDPMAAQGVTRTAPLQFKFTGFEYIKEPESDAIFRLKLVNGQRTRVVQCEMQTFGTFIATQNAAIGSIKNFTLG